MRTNLLIEADGTIIGGTENLLNASSNSGVNNYSLFYNQISLEFFNEIITNPNDTKEPDPDSAVTTGLSGTLTLAPYASLNAPYVTEIPGGNAIDVATTSMTQQFVGILAKLEIESSTVSGCSYINILIDRA